MTRRIVGTRKERFKLCVLSLVSIAQEIVCLCILAYFVPEWRAKLLFSEWTD